MKKFAVIGLGSFGGSLVRTLSKKNCEIIAVDSDPKKVNEIKDIATQPVVMDATKKENLQSLSLTDMDAVIVSTGKNMESSIIIVHHLNELGVSRIIAKALSEDHEKILSLVGANEVTYPERDMAIKLGSRLSFKNLLDYLPIEAGFVIQEIAPPDSFIGKTLAEIDIRKKYNATVVAIKSLIPEQTILNPGGDFLIKESDIMIVLAAADEIENLHRKINS